MGGAAGHMKHPFETYDVLDGKVLLNKFYTLAKVLTENNPTIKLDGANTSFKVINTDKGVRFALDRGTQQDADIKGITTSNMHERFLDSVDMIIIECKDNPSYVNNALSKTTKWFMNGTSLSKQVKSGYKIKKGDVIQINKKFKEQGVMMPKITVKVTGTREHGMIGTTKTQLNLLNKVFEVYPEEAITCLQAMGMVDASGMAILESFLINTEFVDETEAGGAANVITYGLDQPSKFLAFHGLIEIRPTEKGRGDFISNYPTYTINQGRVGEALNLLTQLIEKANEGSGWEFFDASRYRANLGKDISEINIEGALSQTISIKITPENEETKTIRQWLEDPRVVTPPRKDPERPSKGYQSFIIGGVKSQPVSKALYNNLIDSSSGGSGPLSLIELAPDSPDVQNYIMTGAIYYHSTKVIGREIKRQMTNLSGLGMQSLVTVYDEGGIPTEHGHEGIAIQHQDLGIDKDTGYPYIIKVVGDFIVTGAMGRFAVDRPSTPTVTETYLRRLIRESLERFIF